MLLSPLELLMPAVMLVLIFLPLIKVIPRKDFPEKCQDPSGISHLHVLRHCDRLCDLLYV